MIKDLPSEVDLMEYGVPNRTAYLFLNSGHDSERSYAGVAIRLIIDKEHNIN